MISIQWFPPDWGFGNRIMYYNNLRQRAELDSIPWSCCPWNGYEYFSGDVLGSDQHGNLSLKPCLGEKFFDCHSISTRSIFELKEKPKIETESVAIHFRGTDFFGWNPDAVLGEDYYMNALSEIENDVESFYIFTDDETLPSYKGVVEYLNQNNRKVIFGENTANRNNYIKDFSTISECDYIISSPSTYCIAAGFIGKEKKIIHSEKWIHNRVDVDDKFWVDLNNGGNSDYSIWRLV